MAFLPVLPASNNVEQRRGKKPRKPSNKTMFPSLVSHSSSTKLPQAPGATNSEDDFRRYISGREITRIDAALVKALKTMDQNEASTLQSSMKALVKMLSGILKKPESQRLRKIRMQNMIIRKFVLNVAGAMEFVQAVGFSFEEEGSSEYLWMESVNKPLLEKAIELMKKKLKSLSEEGKDAENREREQDRAAAELCYAGCGLLGDPRTEGYCLECYDALHTGELVFVPNEGNACYGIQLPELSPATLAELEAAPPGVVLVRSPVMAPSARPRLCMNGCGKVRVLFMGMCRECWQQKRKDERGRGWRGKLNSAKIKLRALWLFGKAERLKQKNKKRCWSCRRRVGISGIECRCGFIFCGEHRYPDKHDCQFDHRRHQMERLREQNPTIVKKKFDRIDD